MNIRSITGICILAALAACGGGGSGGETPSPATHDSRNGTYKVFATDGRQYTLTVNFDDKSYSMAGNGVNSNGGFTADADAAGFSFAANAKFRTSEDLVVGGFDFGDGVKPFVAARKFVSATSDLSGKTFNALGLNVPAAGSVGSRIYALRFNVDGTMQACLDDVVQTVDNCPAASLWTYGLNASGDEFTGIDVVHNDSTQFSVARSGNSLIYLRAGSSSDGGRRFRIAVPETSGLAGGSFVAASTQGASGSATLTATQYSIAGTTTGGTAFSASASLASLGTIAPQGFRSGIRNSDGASVFVVQGGSLYALLGARNGPASGAMEIGIH